MPFNAYLEKLDKKLHEPNKINEFLEKIEKSTGVRRLHFTLAISGLWAVYMVFGCGAELICNSIGFAYPAYCSIHALETVRKDDDTKWLTYWVTFALFSLLEFFSEFILDFVPFYWLAKCIFLIWCFIPISNNGSQFLYNRVIRPVFLQHKNAIDETLNKAASGMASGVAGLVNEAASKLAKSE